MNIESELKSRQDALQQKIAENVVIKKHIAENEYGLFELSNALKIGREALTFLENIANFNRDSSKNKLENIITEAVKIIYGEEYSVSFAYSVKNNRSCLEIFLLKTTKDGDVKRNMDGFGGGMSDTISVPLRLMILLSSTENRVCILDEPYKHVDLERIELVAKFIREISDKLNLQIIMFSHHEIMQDYANTVYAIDNIDGKSVVKKIK